MYPGVRLFFNAEIEVDPRLHGIPPLVTAGLAITLAVGGLIYLKLLFE
jgi:hypothetical protein